MSKTFLFDDYMNIYNQYAKKYEKLALLYQKGTFYELYDDENTLTNLIEVCKILNITLTRANKKILEISKTNPSLAGIPVCAVDTYIEKLLHNNYTIVIYDQSIDNKTKRVLSKILSPATYIPKDISIGGSEGEEEVSFLTILETSLINKTEFSITLLSISTGKSKLFSIIEDKDTAIQELNKILEVNNFLEVVFVGDEKILPFLKISDKIPIHKNKIEKAFLKTSYQEQFLLKIFKCPQQLNIFEHLSLAFYPNLVTSFVIATQFAYEHDNELLYKLSKPQMIDTSKNLKLSNRILTQLNVIPLGVSEDKSLFDIVNMTSTGMGKRLLKSRLTNPVKSSKILNKLYDEVEKADHVSLEVFLKEIRDIEKLHRKLFLGKLHPFEFYFLDISYKNILKLLQINKYFVKKEIEQSFQTFCKNYLKTFNIEEIQKYNLTNIETNIFKDGIHTDIDEKILLKNTALTKLKNFVKKLNDELGIDDAIKYSFTPSEGYFLTTTKNRYEALKKKSKEIFKSKVQTTTVKLTNDFISDISNTITNCFTTITDLSKKYFLDYCKKTSEKYSGILKIITDYVAYVDVLKSSTKCAELFNYCKPNIETVEHPEGGKKLSYIQAKNMRHPIVERLNSKEFIPNNVEIGKNNNILLFGLNSAGKSVYIKSIVLCVILAQAGLFVPCDEFTFYPFQNINCKMVMSDNLYAGVSSFVQEMMDLKSMLENASENSLNISDELCAGTTHESALSIVSSAIMELTNKKSNFIFTTHLHELCNISKIKDLKNLNFYHMQTEVIDGNIIYKRKLKKGSGDDTYGIEICKALKIGDQDFIKNALSIRAEIKKEHNKILNTKSSKYNSDVYVDKCSKCGTTENLNTHHIKEQHLADKNNRIKGQHKNVKYNLEILCEECHREEHRTE